MIELGLFLLFLKHCIADFFLQPMWMVNHKGTYLHPKGIVHSLIHGIGTFLIFTVLGFSVQLILLASAIDFVTHYHIDWLKMNVNKWFSLGMQDKWFWYLLGVDQFLHYCVYLIIVIVVVS